MKFTLVNIEKALRMDGEFPAPWGFRLCRNDDISDTGDTLWGSFLIITPDAEMAFSGLLQGDWDSFTKALVVAYYPAALEWKQGKPIGYGNGGIQTFPQWLDENVGTPRVEDPYTQEMAPPDAVFNLYRQDVIDQKSRRK